MKKYYFISGLPRSGSTLLNSILNQNPDIYASTNSPVCGLLYNLERAILGSEHYHAYPKPDVVSNTILSVLDGYYSDTDKKIVIDKSREWTVPDSFSVLKRNLPYQPKVIVCVRDILDILASFITLINKNPNSNNFIDLEIQQTNFFNFYREPNDIRCDHLMFPKGLIDQCLYGISYAMLPENKEYFHFVEYENLVNNTEDEINKIYNFLEIEKYVHDYNNIENHIKEDDRVYGLLGMHDVRSSISKRKINKEHVLSDYILNKYSNLEFWRNNEASR